MLQERRWLHVTVPAAADPLALRLISDLRGAAANYCATAIEAKRVRAPGLVFVPLELCHALVQDGAFLAHARAANLGFVFYAPSPTLTERALEGAALRVDGACVGRYHTAPRCVRLPTLPV